MHKQVLNGLENYKPTENRGVSGDYDNIKPEDFVKNTEKKADTHYRYNLENGFPSKNNPVSNISSQASQGFSDNNQENENEQNK